MRRVVLAFAVLQALMLVGCKGSEPAPQPEPRASVPAPAPPAPVAEPAPEASAPAAVVVEASAPEAPAPVAAAASAPVTAPATAAASKPPAPKPSPVAPTAPPAPVASAPAPSPAPAAASVAKPEPPPAPKPEPASAPAPAGKKVEVKDPGGKIEMKPTKSGTKRVGVDRCGTCHEIQQKSWEASGHAKRDPQLDCESCHGPGSEYKKSSIMKDAEAAKKAGLTKPGKDFCAKCHVGEVDDAMLKKVHEHGKVSTSEDE